MNAFLWYLSQIPGGIATGLAILLSFATFVLAFMGLCSAYFYVGTRFDRWINGLSR